MKNFLQLFLVVLIFSLMSCEKEEQVSVEETDDLTSNSLFDNEGAFKEEIVITDESGQNSVFYVIYSDDKDLLSEFLEVNDFSLLINEDDVEIFNSAKLSENEPLKSNSNDFELDQEPKIIIDLITTNLQEDVKTYSLDIKQNNSKSTKFLFGYPVGYTTKNNFIGVVHYGWGYEFVVKLRYKSKWYKSWKYYTKDGANSWFVNPSSTYYASLKMSSYKLGLTIYPHKYQNTKNYRVTYSLDGFRGNQCEIGRYNGTHCYVGTPPSGTEAFYYPNGIGGYNFYYTPVNGNQCPYPGSHFDGANCYVMQVPNSCVPFVYQNHWYVKSDLIL